MHDLAAWRSLGLTIAAAGAIQSDTTEQLLFWCRVPQGGGTNLNPSGAMRVTLCG